MSRLLFTHSYFLRFDPKQWETGQPYAPLGTLYAASVMRENNYAVSFFDNMFSKSANDIQQTVDKTLPDFFVIYDDGFNYLTKMCLTNMREAAFRMCKIAKARGCAVIVSGSDSTDHAREYLEHGADYVIMGEAEMTLLELTTHLSQSNTDVSAIPGLAYLSY